MGDIVPFTKDGVGTIEYTKPIKEIQTAAGIFSFTYYTRADFETINPIYTLGLYTYEQVCANFMKGWKCVVYTDEETMMRMEQIMKYIEEKLFQNSKNERVKYYDKQSKEGLKKMDVDIAKGLQLWIDLLNSPNVVFAIVRWPQYSVKQDTSNVDDSLMRIFRFRAFTEFPDIPVFVRDADTIFVKDLWRLSTEAVKVETGKKEKYVYVDTYLFNKAMPYFVSNWESTMFEEQKKTGLPFLICSQSEYFRQWHTNRYTQIPSQGVYAGVVNSLGGISEFKDGSLWDETIAYVTKGIEMVNTIRGFQVSNKRTIYYIGKDEQLLIFVYIPILFERTFFYLLDFQHKNNLISTQINEITRKKTSILNNVRDIETKIKEIKTVIDKKKKGEVIEKSKPKQTGLHWIQQKPQVNYSVKSIEELEAQVESLDIRKKELEEIYEKIPYGFLHPELIHFVFQHPEFHEEIKKSFMNTIQALHDVHALQNKKVANENIPAVMNRIQKYNKIGKETHNYPGYITPFAHIEKAIQEKEFYKTHYRNIAKNYKNIEEAHSKWKEAKKTQTAGTRKRLSKRSKKQRTHKRKC